MLKIRLQRYGKKKAPVYRISVMEKTTRRDGKPVEVLGFYDPISKLLVYNTERAAHWKQVGAQASETVEFLLKKDPIHDLKNGPYIFKSKSREDKEKVKEEILKQTTKITKAKKKKAEAEAAANQAPTEEAAA
jgi:small subunit ribosomal protein S16